MATGPSPILITEGSTSWWHNLPLCEGLRPCAGGRPFVSSWFGLEVDRTTCMPFEQMILLYETQPWRSSINVPSLLNQWKFIFFLSFTLNWSDGARLYVKLKTESSLNLERTSSETNMKFPQSSDCAFSGAKAVGCLKIIEDKSSKAESPKLQTQG